MLAQKAALPCLFQYFQISTRVPIWYRGESPSGYAIRDGSGIHDFAHLSSMLLFLFLASASHFVIMLKKQSCEKKEPDRETAFDTDTNLFPNSLQIIANHHMQSISFASGVDVVSLTFFFNLILMSEDTVPQCVTQLAWEIH